MAEIYTRKIKAVIGNPGTGVIIQPTVGKVVHGFLIKLSYAGGTNTLAAAMTALTEIRCKVGTVNKWKLNGTKLRDRQLLHGTTYDFNGLPNTAVYLRLMFAPEWYLENVAASLAWNPAQLGGPISVEIDSSTSNTYEVWEIVSDVAAPSSGIITLETVKANVSGVETVVQKPQLKPIGHLVLASIYPDSGATNEITPASMYVGSNDAFAHEVVSSAANDEILESCGLTPAASGRTANVYDIVCVKGDQLNRAVNLAAWGEWKLKLEAGSAMSGTSDILLERIE